LGESASRAGSVDVVRAKREAKRLQSSEAWELWQSDEKAVTPAHAREVFRIDSYTKPEMLVLKIDRLLNLFGDDAGMSKFLREMSQLVQEGGE
jgi:hypothetical protein